MGKLKGMGEFDGLRKRVGMILGAVVVLAIGIPWLGGAMTSGAARHEAVGPLGALPAPVPAGTVPRAEAGQFELSYTDLGTDPTIDGRPGTGSRTLASFYRLRAFPGAPPVISHRVDAETSRTQECTSCHSSGGYAPTFSAYTPVTPHAEFQNCMQCHVPSEGGALFRGTKWQAGTRPSIGGAALDGSPPPIPHELQLRERCASCHSGPAAVAEIRTTHPERLYCQQCHLQQVEEELFARAGGDR